MSVANPGPSTLSPMTDETDRQRAFASLRHRDFRLLWMGQIVSVTGSQMQLAAINWHVYLLTRSALALGLVGACRAVPIILCSLVGGVVALGSVTVMIGGLPAARQGDMVTEAGAPNPIVSGATTVMIG